MNKHFLDLEVGDKVICVDEYSGGNSYHTLMIDYFEDDKEYATESNPLGRRFWGTDLDYINDDGEFEEGDSEYLTIVTEGNFVMIV